MEGSNPSWIKTSSNLALTFYIGVSPSGKAKDFDSFTDGSNPSTPAKENLIFLKISDIINI